MIRAPTNGVGRRAGMTMPLVSVVANAINTPTKKPGSVRRVGTIPRPVRAVERSPESGVSGAAYSGRPRHVFVYVSFLLTGQLADDIAPHAGRELVTIRAS